MSGRLVRLCGSPYDSGTFIVSSLCICFITIANKFPGALVSAKVDSVAIFHFDFASFHYSTQIILTSWYKFVPSLHIDIPLKVIILI